jgi:8-oxo-dGTP pyrophosphatase MutT (NUDIX family)
VNANQTGRTHPMLQALQRNIQGRSRRRLDRSGRAAVLLTVIDDGGPLRLLLTRRTNRVATHKGQVAFPGGFMEDGEQNPVFTALREAWEEIGLPPGSVDVVGLLDDFLTVTGEVAVTPVVGRIEQLPRLKPQEEEVARIFEIPVADLLKPEGWRMIDSERFGRNWTIYFFDYDGETLWGLSAYLVLHFLEIAGVDAPHRLCGFNLK